MIVPDLLVGPEVLKASVKSTEDGYLYLNMV